MERDQVAAVKRYYDRLESLLPSLMYFVVLPYEGHEAAAEAFAVN